MPNDVPPQTGIVAYDGEAPGLTVRGEVDIATSPELKLAIDDAIRRIVQSQTPYQAFPPALARQWDVIEIRRTWYFDMAIRLY